MYLLTITPVSGIEKDSFAIQGALSMVLSRDQPDEFQRKLVIFMLILVCQTVRERETERWRERA